MAEKVKKQNAVQRYVNETTGELRKVSWPTREEALQLTLIVVVVMIFMGAFLGLVDLIGRSLLRLALGL